MVFVFCYRQDLVINKWVGITFIMIIRFTAYAVKTVQAKRGTYPDKPQMILENTIGLLWWKAFGGADSFETDNLILRPAYQW